MTNKQFADWRRRHFRSVSACAAAFGLHRETIQALESGKTSNGAAYPVRPHMALACAAWAMGWRGYDGVAPKLAALAED